LRARLRQHYDPSSPLSHRLVSAGTSIHKTSIVFLPVLDNTLKETSATQDNDDVSDDEANSDDENQNQIFEEIFSRIFSPLFTIRYG